MVLPRDEDHVVAVLEEPGPDNAADRTAPKTTNRITRGRAPVRGGTPRAPATSRRRATPSSGTRARTERLVSGRAPGRPTVTQRDGVVGRFSRLGGRARARKSAVQLVTVHPRADVSSRPYVHGQPVRERRLVAPQRLWLSTWGQTAGRVAVARSLTREPTEFLGNSRVGREGLEPPTSCASCRRAANCANGPEGARSYQRSPSGLQA